MPPPNWKPPRRGPKPRTPIARGTAPVRRTPVRKVSDKQRTKIRLRTDVTRPMILREDRRRCRACGFRDGVAWGGGVRRTWLEVNEHPPRSLGGDMNNPAHCITMCANMHGDGCHQRYTAGKIKIRVLDDTRGCRAPVEFTEGDRVWQG